MIYSFTHVGHWNIIIQYNYTNYSIIGDFILLFLLCDGMKKDNCVAYIYALQACADASRVDQK